MGLVSSVAILADCVKVLQQVEMPEPAVSRVLSGTIIHLGWPSPTTSSNLPGSPLGTGGVDKSTHSPIWSCSGRGLPCRELLPVARCALTAPFHPYPATQKSHLAVYFLWHFPWVCTPQALPGALSEGARTFLHDSCELQRLPGRLRHFRAQVYANSGNPARSSPVSH